MLKLEEGTVLSSNLFLFMHLASYHGQFLYNLMYLIVISSKILLIGVWR